MEGRTKPPIAEHPWPDDLDLRKFWGPYAKAAGKILLKTAIVYTCVWHAWKYWKRNDNTSVYGIPRMTSEETVRMRMAALFAGAEIPITMSGLKHDTDMVIPQCEDDFKNDKVELLRPEPVTTRIKFM